MKKVGKAFFVSLLALILAAGLFSGTVFAASAPASAASDEPVLRVALFSDLHVEFGLPSKDEAIRPSTVAAAEYLSDLTDGKGVDVILVGGDMSGDRGNWTAEEITKVKTTIHKTLSGATKDGKVLYVAGNHDSDPSIKVGVKQSTDYSGDYSALMKQGCGEFVNALYSDDIREDLSPYNEVLCYRYTIGGMEFIGISTPYLTDWGKSGLYPQQTQWVEEELEAIGKDKTVFILCHYPLGTFVTMSNASTVSSFGNICHDQLEDLLQEYPNAIYCFGHLHEGDDWWVKIETSELVTVPAGMTDLGNDRYSPKGYIYSHMGSMGYYNTPYQPGPLGADDPVVVQFVLVDFYTDRITFQYCNAGKKIPKNAVWEPDSLTFARDLSGQLTVATVSDPADGSPDPVTDGENGNTLAVIILILLGVILVGIAVVAVVVLRKKPEPKGENGEAPETTAETAEDASESEA